MSSLPEASSPLFRVRVLGWLALSLAAIAAWFPFVPEVPYWQRHGPVVETNWTFIFDGRAALLGAGPMPWLEAARVQNDFHLLVVAKSTDSVQGGPARLVSINRDSAASNVVIGQDGAHLIVRLRRPFSSQQGRPEFVVENVFSLSVIRWRAATIATASPLVTRRAETEVGLVRSAAYW